MSSRKGIQLQWMVTAVLIIFLWSNNDNYEYDLQDDGLEAAVTFSREVVNMTKSLDLPSIR